MARGNLPGVITPRFRVAKEAVRMTKSDLSGTVIPSATLPDAQARQKLRSFRVLAGLARAGVLPR